MYLTNSAIMRNIIYVYLLALVSLFFFSCNPTESDIECEKIFELHFGGSKNTPFYLSQMIDTVSYIELDSSVAIGNIDEIVCSNEDKNIKSYNDKYNADRNKYRHKALESESEI